MNVETSILLPVFNGALFLRPQLDSILAQTYRPFELLIYDDGSTDASPRIIEEFAALDRRIHFERQSVNLGQGAALRRLLELSRGDLIAFSDQDDVWHLEKLARLRAAIDGWALAYGSSNLIDAEGREMGSQLANHVSVWLEGTDNAKFLLKNSVSGHALLTRRTMLEPSVFAASRPYDWLIATIATFAGGVIYLGDAVTYHRMHANNQLHGALGSKRKKRPTHWRTNCLALRETLGILTNSQAVAVEKRKVFRELCDLVSDELVGGGLGSLKSYAFPRRFIATAAQLNIGGGDLAYLARRLPGLRAPPMKAMDRLRLAM